VGSEGWTDAATDGEAVAAGLGLAVDEQAANVARTIANGRTERGVRVVIGASDDPWSAL
jgi:hypothetical protein